MDMGPEIGPIRKTPHLAEAQGAGIVSFLSAHRWARCVGLLQTGVTLRATVEPEIEETEVSS